MRARQVRCVYSGFAWGTKAWQGNGEAREEAG